MSSNHFKRNLSVLLILLLFFGQVIGIINGQLSKPKFFAWSPYDEISYYKIEGILNGEKLTKDDISNRYRISAIGRQNRSIYNIISIVRQYETSYGLAEPAKIEISYIVNGHKKSTWKWPEDEFD